MSINYYNKKAKEFIENTFHANMSELYKIFEQHLNENDLILDLGSGTGRDSLYFLSKGYDVVAIDASEEMVNYSKPFLQEKVLISTFSDFNPKQKFDAIWACASLLHLEDNELNKTIFKYLSHLKTNGVFYMSFKKGNENYFKDNRFFNCFTKDSFTLFINQFHTIEIIDLFETSDVRPNKENEEWINAIIRKI